MQTIIKLTTLIFLCLLLSCSVERTNGNFAKLQSGILDNADILTNSQEDSISRVIVALKESVGPELAVVTIDSLGKNRLEDFSLKMADSLRLGRASHNDGLLILVSRMDRKIRIEVGTGLENIIKDEIAAAIIREDIVPRFREDKYGPGVYHAVSRISELIRADEKLVGTEPNSK